jgi:uncharacterized membrane protein required for colicin V production
MNLPINWFDILILLVMVAGLARGRKRGLSEELITMLQWLATVVICTFTYKPVGQFLVSISGFSLLFCRVSGYILLMIGVWLVFTAVRKTFGGKLVGSDMFGKGEYYLGAPAGMLRFLCILLTIVAVLNARLYTEKEVRANEVYTKDVYGSDFFPGLYQAQQDVFVKSFTGPLLRQHASLLLIEPTVRDVKVFKQKEYEFPGKK